MKVYVLTINYYRTDSLWGDEYYPATDILKVYSDEEQPKNLCKKWNDEISRFCKYKGEFSWELYPNDTFDITDETGEIIYTIDRCHEEKVYLNYKEHDVV